MFGCRLVCQRSPSAHSETPICLANFHVRPVVHLLLNAASGNVSGMSVKHFGTTMDHKWRRVVANFMRHYTYPTSLRQDRDRKRVSGIIRFCLMSSSWTLANPFSRPTAALITVSVFWNKDRFFLHMYIGGYMYLFPGAIGVDGFKLLPSVQCLRVT